MSENLQRKNKSPKRNTSTNLAKQSKLSTKTLKNSTNHFTQLKTTEEICQDFETRIAPFFAKQKYTINIKEEEISMEKEYPFHGEYYSNRYEFFEAFSGLLFPIISLPNHYLAYKIKPKLTKKRDRAISRVACACNFSKKCTPLLFKKT